MIMNPEAVQWLEAIPVEDRPKFFIPVYPYDGFIASIKKDHEPCVWCGQALRHGKLLVIE